MGQATRTNQYLFCKKSGYEIKEPLAISVPPYTFIALLPECLSCLFKVHLTGLSKGTLISVTDSILFRTEL